MKCFLDASVIVAILLDEDDGDEWIERVERCDGKMTSPIAIWEAARAVSRVKGCDPDVALRQVEQVLAGFEVEIAPVGDDEGVQAVTAHQRFGKTRHPAKLNMGDCFAYACAKTNNATLLYKGDDFAKTDLA